MATTLDRNKPGLFHRIVSGVKAFADPAALNLGLLTREVGIPGGTVKDGLSVSNYNPDLSGAEWFNKVDEMLTASSQAAVVELCVTLPIVSAEWSLTGGDAKLREQVETSLFGSAGMSTTWREVLYNACQAALFGTAVFEVIWKETPDGLLVRRLVDRDPASVDSYEFDKDGGLSAIVQTGTDPDTGDEVEAKVPIEKCLLFPYRLRRREYHGRSILRAAYRHYESVAMLCTFADIGLDHSLAGLPIGKAPQGAKPKDIAAFNDLLATIRRHEAAGVTLPYGWDLVDGLQLGGNDKVGFLDYLQWHEGAFLRSALCSFMQLGSTPTGTTELGGALMQFSMLSWGALADMIAGQVTRHLIRRHCDYNAGGELDEKAYPELVPGDIRSVFADQQQAGQFLGAVASGQETLPSDPAAREAAVKEGLTLPDGDTRKEGAPAPQTKPRQFAETPTQSLEAVVARVGADQEAALDAWGRSTLPVIRDLLSGLLAQLPEGDDPEAAAAVAAPAGVVARLGMRVAEWLLDAHDAAWQRMEEELGVAADPPAETIARLRARAQVIAEDLAAVAEREVRLAALRGESAAAIAAAFEEAVGGRLGTALRDAGKLVAEMVSAGNAGD